MNRRNVLALAGAGLAWSIRAGAKTPEPRHRVGHLFIGPATISRPYRDAFVSGLRELGYEIGGTLAYDERYANGEAARLPALIDELIALKPNVLVGVGQSARLMMAKTSIPIVMSNAFDPVEAGLVKSLSHPGGMVTGIANLGPSLVAKQIDILSEVVPRMARIVLLNDSSLRHIPGYDRAARAAARAKGAAIRSLFADDRDTITAAFAAMTVDRPDALVVGAAHIFFSFRDTIIAGAQQVGVPAIYPYEAYVKAGGLLSYNGNVRDGFRRAATFVAKILEGAKPDDLPVEQPTTFELHVNLKTATALGLTIPRSLLLRADQVIEE